MPSTYSTNLGLELPADGEQSGSWGQTTNRNLGTLVEQAISGYTTQAIADVGDTTVTIPNGATGVGRNMYLELTGALTGTRNLIVPSNKKLYFIYNNTSGSQSVVVKVSGQTGVTVPNGKRVVLVCNGTDVVVATNYLIGEIQNGVLTTGSYANPSWITSLAASKLTGTVAIANGGTGATSAATARTGLGATTVGSNVFTLANPNAIRYMQINADNTVTALDAATFRANIGAGSGSSTITSVGFSTSLSGLSVSGSPITSGAGTISLSGTLAVASGGTGATTATNARTNLGLGSLATLSTINNSNWSGTSLAIANGGTGATTASAALAALGGISISASALTANGYIKLDNGLYIMWGSFSATADTSTTFSYSTISGSISLTTFSRAVVSGVGEVSTSAQDNWPAVSACTTTGFTVYNASNVGSPAATTFFIAIGY